MGSRIVIPWRSWTPSLFAWQRWHHMRTQVQMKLLQSNPFPGIIRAIRGEQYIWSCNCSSHIQLIVWHIHENSMCHDICRLISNPGNSLEQIMYVCVYVSTLYLLLSNSPCNSNPWCFKSLSLTPCTSRSLLCKRSKKKKSVFHCWRLRCIHNFIIMSSLLDKDICKI